MSRLFKLPILLLFLSVFVHADSPSFQNDVFPILQHRCMACHACYDSPCQLNLSSAEGVARGASKDAIYGVTRTQAMQPTRLGMDADSIHSWRSMGFYSVLNPKNPLMARMLELGHGVHWQNNQKLPKDIVLGVARADSCPSTQAEFDHYAEKHPLEGMPLGVHALSTHDYALLQQWLSAGAPMHMPAMQPTAPEQRAILHWEDYMNQTGRRHQLLARWLYEHWYIAQIYFPEGSADHFFRWVRSSTPTGQAIHELATRLPNDPPGAQHFYYRLKPIEGALAYKTHIVLELPISEITLIEKLFFQQPWSVNSLPGYEVDDRANPFITFADLPAEARYRYMLLHAEYFVRTFIRGPVCRGQLATDVIRDQFWTFFQDPSSDLYITKPHFQKQANPFLALPGQLGGLIDLPTQWLKYRHLRNRYEDLRQKAYGQFQPQGTGISDIWSGNPNAFLTIFRHGDSATVHQGLLGAPPKTLWMMDFPLFEQTYYELVVNFDVFGTTSHQAQTRLYFDLIRYAAETNFLRLMPAQQRQSLLDSWYLDSGKIKLWLDYTPIDTSIPAADSQSSPTPVLAFEERLLHSNPTWTGSDPINRCTHYFGCARPDVPHWQARAERAFSGLIPHTAATLPVILRLPEATLIRVFTPDGQQMFYSLLRNRAHSNVAFILGEDWRYEPSLDNISIEPGLLTSYPNFAFDVPASDATRFVHDLGHVHTDQDWEQLIQHWGVRRTSNRFWPLLDHLIDFLNKTEPREAAIPDINRYENR